MESFDNKKIEFYIQFNFMNALGCFFNDDAKFEYVYVLVIIMLCMLLNV